METVHLAGRTVNRIGLSLAGLRATGMWGEPAGREEAVRVIRRAVELGAGVVEVPVPFGPAADLLREADVREAFVAARLTGPTGLAVVKGRLGRVPDLILAGPELLAPAADWGVPLGVIGNEGRDGLAAVRGPYPPPDDLLQWCEDRQIPYMATEIAVLQDGRHTIALPATATPPAGGPG